MCVCVCVCVGGDESGDDAMGTEIFGVKHGFKWF